MGSLTRSFLNYISQIADSLIVSCTLTDIRPDGCFGRIFFQCLDLITFEGIYLVLRSSPKLCYGFFFLARQRVARFRMSKGSGRWNLVIRVEISNPG